MNIKHIIILLVLVIASSSIFGQQTEIQYLSGTEKDKTVDWDFFCTEGQNSGKWTKIPVPSNWELQGFGAYNFGIDYQNKDRVMAKEHGLYKYDFVVPKSWKGKKVNIVFDGSMTDTDVKINGKTAGPTHRGAFYRFKYDITKLLKYGQTNKLEVDVAKHSSNESVNRAERYADYWIFGGIYRPVFLEALPKQHINRLSIDAKVNGELTANVYFEKAAKNISIKAAVYTLDGKKVGNSFSELITNGDNMVVLNHHFNKIKTWNAEDPNLYKLELTLFSGDKLIHKIEDRFGFRTIEVKPHDGIYVNGVKVILKGTNRHSFWPTTGRTLNEEIHRLDINLMQEMNMNAVRMSHYPPDKRFLELCDSLGLYVLDEIAGWGKSYDTIVGPKVIKETILRDENHPSVIMWNHSNEGGWNMANEKWFHEYDMQKRPILHPFANHNFVDTHHYPGFQEEMQNQFNGNNIYMPTEMLHGLYDGGNGAALEDYWNLYKSKALFAGGFLWAYVDEAVVRTDRNGAYDVDVDRANDGIVGPYREKEASFYTVKKIWSPVQVSDVAMTKYFNGELFLENDYSFTNLSQCSFSWRTANSVYSKNKSEMKTLASGKIKSPDIAPGLRGKIEIDLPSDFSDAEIFYFTAHDPKGNELYTWSWLVKEPAELVSDIINTISGNENDIKTSVNDSLLTAKAGQLKLIFNLRNGFLHDVINQGKEISFNGGPLPVGTESELKGVEWALNENKDLEVIIKYADTFFDYPPLIKWTLKKSGLLKLEVAPPHYRRDDDNPLLGVSFNYPEAKVTGMSWFGKGPYRVWKNRMQGVEYNVWHKDYNNTVTGESFEKLIYPEFKGYHANTQWVVVENNEQDFGIITETPNLFMQMFAPKPPASYTENLAPVFPEGDISFLYTIPAIGTKFRLPEMLGPQSRPHHFTVHGEGTPIVLWFDFIRK